MTAAALHPVNGTSKTRPTPLTVYAGDLAQPLGPIPWLVEELCIASGRPTVFVGEGGSRKSWLAMALALSVAGDRQLLGFRVRSGRALHLDYEQGRRMTAERYQALALGLGLELASLDKRLAYRWRPMSWRGSKVLDTLCWHVEGFDLVVVDPLRACLAGVDENSMAASAPLDLATEASERTGATFVFVDHAGKPKLDDHGAAARSRKHSNRGHSSKLDASQTLIVLSAAKGEPTLVTCERNQLSGRLFDDFEFNISSDGQGGLRLAHVERPATTESTPDEAFERLCNVVLDVIQHHPGIGSAGEVAQRAGKRKSSVLDALRALETRGLISNKGTSRTAPAYFAVPADTLGSGSGTRFPLKGEGTAEPVPGNDREPSGTAEPQTGEGA